MSEWKVWYQFARRYVCGQLTVSPLLARFVELQEALQPGT